jgi:hypothetical protein
MSQGREPIARSIEGRREIGRQWIARSVRSQS